MAWIVKLQKSLVDATGRGNAQEASKLRNYIAVICANVICAFDVPNTRYNIIFASTHIVDFLHALARLNENTFQGKLAQGSPLEHQHQHTCAMQVLFNCREYLHGVFSKTDEFLQAFLPAYGIIENITQWQRIGKTDLYQTALSTSICTFNICNGSFLIDGAPLNRLPNEVESNPLFSRVFGSAIFEVHRNGQLFRTHKLNDSTFEFLVAPNEQVFITEIRDEGKFLLLDYQLMQFLFPYALVHDYSHWANIKEQVVEFRPVNFANRGAVDFKASIATGKVRCCNNNRLLISIGSTFFREVEKIFDRLDASPHIQLFGQTSSPGDIDSDDILPLFGGTSTTEDNSDDIIPLVVLPRLGLDFCIRQRFFL